MPRIYLPLQVDFDDDEKVARLARYGAQARGCRDLLVGMWRYCKREKSDGHVPVEIVGKLVYPDAPRNGVRDADRLVEVGIAERTDDGYYLPGFLKHNKSREQIAAEAIAKATAGAKGGKASGEVRRGEADTKQGASPARSHKTETEDKEQRTEIKVVEKLGGQRTETPQASNATEPTCSTHPLGDGGTACRGCRAVREWRDRNQAAADRARELDRTAALLAEANAAKQAAVRMPESLRKATA